MKLRISKAYEKQVVFDNLELDVEKGKILCVLGESGGGKTTFLNILAGLTTYEGTVENLPKQVGYIFQEPRLLPNLTVEENLRYVGGTPEKIDELLQKSGSQSRRKGWGQARRLPRRKTACCHCACIFERRGYVAVGRAVFVAGHRFENPFSKGVRFPLAGRKEDGGIRYARYRRGVYAGAPRRRFAERKNCLGFGYGRRITPRVWRKCGGERKNFGYLAWRIK